MFKMPTPLRSMSTRLDPWKAFLRDDGAMSVEAAIIMPCLMFLYAGGFSYFDGYRREAAVARASYTVGDLLSRKEDSAITPKQLQGMERLFELLTFSEGESWMRVSELQRKGDTVEVVWSYASSGNPSLTNARLASKLHRIPTLDDNERIVAVETFTHYTPFVTLGVQERIFDTFVATRQRWWPQLAMDPTGLPDNIVLAQGNCPEPEDAAGTYTSSGIALTWEGQLMCGMEPIPVSDVDQTSNGNGNGNGNNGWGNGDQDAPGNSGDNNNAENSDRDPPPGQQKKNDKDDDSDD